MIRIFKTSVETHSQVQQLGHHINMLCPNLKWNFDLEDCDRILRIDSDENIAEEITSLLNSHSFDCEEIE